jgi:hypothetical protein
MYYPLSQITTNLYTAGGELQYLDNGKYGQLYTGNYFKTSDGKYFTGKTPQDVPNDELILTKRDIGPNSPLDPLSYDPTNIIQLPTQYTNANNPKPVATMAPRISIPFPTQADYATGEFQRYFLKRRTNYTYLEVDQLTYENIINKNPNSQFELYEGKVITWILTGKLLEVYRINYNITELVERRDGWLGFPLFFKNNFTKYFSFEASSPVFLYTKGSELKLESTGLDYVGYYHVSPIGRITAGQEQTRAAQEYLIPYKEHEKVNQSKYISTIDSEVGTSRRQNIPFMKK